MDRQYTEMNESGFSLRRLLLATGIGRSVRTNTKRNIQKDSYLEIASSKVPTDPLTYLCMLCFFFN